MLVDYKIFKVADGNKDYFWPVWMPGMLLCHPLILTSMASRHTCTHQSSGERLRGPSADPQDSLSPLRALPHCLQLHWSPRTLSRVFSIKEPTGLYLGSPVLLHSLETLPRQAPESLVGITWFVPSLSRVAVLHCLMANILKTIFMYFVHFCCCFIWKGRSSRCYSILAGSRIFLSVFNSNVPSFLLSCIMEKGM